jgi:hypothetical protein
LIQGYAINDKRIKEHAASLKTLQNAVQMLADLSERKALTSDEAKGLFQVIRDYSYSLSVLDDYDHGRVAIKSATQKESYRLTYEDAMSLIRQSAYRSRIGMGYKADGGKRVADNALVAITLMTAESQPEEKNIITALVVNLINKMN